LISQITGCPGQDMLKKPVFDVTLKFTP
jgi:hypothetical protein